MVKRILALMMKEFLSLLKDRRSRTVVFLPPVVQLLVFGYAATFDLSHIPYAFYNEDSGAAARELAAHFRGSPNFEEQAVIRSEGEIARRVDSRDVLMVVHVGPRFSRDLLRGVPAPVQVVIDGRDSNTALVALGYAQAIVNGFNREWIQTHGLRPPPAHLDTRFWFNPNVESRWFIVPGIVGVLTLVVTILVTAMTVAREREQGTFDQLLVTPLRPVEILMGKALPGFLIGLFEATLIITVSVLWFGVPLIGNLLYLYLGLVLFLMSGIGVGLMISSFAVTQQQGMLGAFIFLVPAIILSGFATPIANMPVAMQYATYLDPLRYFMIILRSVFLQDTPFSLLVPQYWPMAVIGLTSLALAGWLFRHRMY